MNCMKVCKRDAGLNHSHENEMSTFVIMSKYYTFYFKIPCDTSQ